MTRWSVILLSCALWTGCAEPVDPEDNDSSVFDGAGSTSLTRKDLVLGQGAEAKSGDMITAHYVLRVGGRVIESSYESNRPIKKALRTGELIDGWVLGVPGMREGGKRRLLVPARLGYGSRMMGQIPPNSDLEFEIELLRVHER